MPSAELEQTPQPHHQNGPAGGGQATEAGGGAMRGVLRGLGFDAGAELLSQGLNTVSGLLGGGTAPQGQQQAAEATSSYDDGRDAMQRLHDLWADGKTPTVRQISSAIHELTVAQRTSLGSDTAFLQRLVDLCQAPQLAGLLEMLFLEPKQQLNWYIIKKGGTDLNIIKRMIGLGNLEQRKEMIGWYELCEAIRKATGDLHPENVFGSDITAELTSPLDYAKTLVHVPWWVKWWFSTTRVDVDANFERMAASVENLRSAMGGSTALWPVTLAAAPRGQALSQSSRAALDTIALELGEALGERAYRDAFEVRFAMPFVDGSDMGETDFDFTKQHMQEMWRALKDLPPGHVTQGAMRRVAVFNQNGAGYGGWHAWALSGVGNDGTGFGDMAIGHGGGDLENNLDDEGTLEYYHHTIRHEVGHAVDIQVGGFEKFSATSPAAWKRYHTKEAFVDEFIQCAGGDEVLRQAALDFLNDAIDIDAWDTAVMEAEDREALTADSFNMMQALPNVKGGGQTVDNDDMNIGGRKFLFQYQTQYMSYAVAGEDSSGITSYAYYAWPEFFAEVYAKYFDGTPPDYDRGANLPGWAAKIGAVVGDEVPAKKVKDGIGGKTPEAP